MTQLPPIRAIFFSLLCALGVGGCGMDPSILMAAPKGGIAPMSLTVDTIPSGAQARTRDGASCQTPCDLTVAPMGPFMVEFTLKNYEPLSVEVVLAPLNPADLSAGLRLDPNPVTVELIPLPRPILPAKPKPVAKPSVPKSMWPEVAGAVWPAAR